MATITAKDVMTLRKATGLGMMEAKKALEETNGDMQAATDLLRQRGLTKMEGRTDRESSEGKVAVALNAGATKGAIIAVNTETDFTAKNEAFVAMASELARLALEQPAGEVEKTDAMQARIDDIRITTKENAQWGQGRVFEGGKIGSYVHHDGKTAVMIQVEGAAEDTLLRQLCMHIAAIVPAPLGVTDEEIPAEIVAKERQIAKAQAMESGKPENIAEKMVEGKIRKFYDSVVLLRQPFVMDDKQQIKDILPQGVTIKAFARYKVGG